MLIYKMEPLDKVLGPSCVCTVLYRQFEPGTKYAEFALLRGLSGMHS
jgi:hypothetical protein